MAQKKDKGNTEIKVQYPLIISAGVPLPPCNCDAVISYTTQQMAVNEQQTLTATGESSFPLCKVNEEYTWYLTGGGSISKTSGLTTVYTAPSANALCSNNGTIELKCRGAVVDTLNIAVNAVLVCANSPAAGAATVICCDSPSGRCMGYYRCDGMKVSTSDGCCGGGQSNVHCSSCLWDSGQPCRDFWTERKCSDFFIGGSCAAAGYVTGEWDDIRTQEQLDAGCCPQQVL